MYLQLRRIRFSRSDAKCELKVQCVGFLTSQQGRTLTTIPITRFRNVSNHWIPPDITFCLLSKLLCPAHRCTYYHFQYSIRTLLVMSHILLRSSVMWIHFIIIRMNNLVTFFNNLASQEFLQFPCPIGNKQTPSRVSVCCKMTSGGGFMKLYKWSTEGMYRIEIRFELDEIYNG